MYPSGGRGAEKPTENAMKDKCSIFAYDRWQERGGLTWTGVKESERKGRMAGVDTTEVASCSHRLWDEAWVR